MNRDQLKKLEKDLWSAADKLRANSDLKASEYSTPVLGLIFLKFADNKYRQHEAAILAEYEKLKGTRRERSLEDIAVEKCGFYLERIARYEHLLHLPGDQDIITAIRAAMKSIERSKPELGGVLPQQEYDRFKRSDQSQPILRALLRQFSDIPADASGDVFGQIYEYFLGEFALSEGQGRLMGVPDIPSCRFGKASGRSSRKGLCRRTRSIRRRIAILVTEVQVIAQPYW